MRVERVTPSDEGHGRQAVALDTKSALLQLLDLFARQGGKTREPLGIVNTAVIEAIFGPIPNGKRVTRSRNPC
jgi:hypothetical protein